MIASLQMPWKSVLIAAAAWAMAQSVWAASCCGGGAASSLIVPKFAKAMVDTAVDVELYDGFWNGDGDHVPDPPGSELKQYRVNLGYGHRLGSRASNWHGPGAGLEPYRLLLQCPLCYK
jgi:hypothetical protein